MSLLLRRRALAAVIPQPGNGPVGGPSWLVGRPAPYDYAGRQRAADAAIAARRKRRRQDEDFLLAMR